MTSDFDQCVAESFVKIFSLIMTQYINLILVVIYCYESSNMQVYFNRIESVLWFWIIKRIHVMKENLPLLTV